MASETYGTTADIPGDNTTVRSGDTVAVSAAFETTLGLVGGIDTANASASAGSVVEVETSAEAETEFGTDSELAEQIDLAFQNGAGSVFAYGVSETDTTENFASSTQGTLSNAPAFDPNLHPDHDITETNVSAVSVNIVYGDAHSTTPDTDTINLNPHTGDWKADSSDTYDISYTYSDDYSSGITEVAKNVPRILAVLSSDSSLGTDIINELNNYDVDFDFMHGMVGASPEASPGSYSDSYDDRRLSVIAPPLAFTDDAETNYTRTIGPAAGKQAGKSLGDSTTYEGLFGLTGLHTSYTNSELATLIDNQVYPIKDSTNPTVIKDMTTSTDTRFERIYASEIVDEVTEISHDISSGFVGDANIEDNRTALLESHTSSYREMTDDDLLDGYHVSVGTSGDFTATLDIGIEVVGLMDTIDVTITVGDVVQNQGAA